MYEGGLAGDLGFQLFFFVDSENPVSQMCTLLYDNNVKTKRPGYIVHVYEVYEVSFGSHEF